MVCIIDCLLIHLYHYKSENAWIECIMSIQHISLSYYKQNCYDVNEGGHIFCIDLDSSVFFVLILLYSVFYVLILLYSLF